MLAVFGTLLQTQVQLRQCDHTDSDEDEDDHDQDDQDQCQHMI